LLHAFGELFGSLRVLLLGVLQYLFSLVWSPLLLLLRLRGGDPSQEQDCSNDDDRNSEVELMGHDLDTRLVEGARRYREAPSVPRSEEHRGSLILIKRAATARTNQKFS
jgi:hypothetical protein